MRADMAKVIVERPRYGSSSPAMKKGYLKTLQTTPIEDQPRHEPMLGRWRGMDRQLNEHLGPMRRFLRSQIGRPWNKVHQELCEHVSFDNAVQKHILAHIDQFVESHVTCKNGQLVRIGYGRPWPLSVGQMYVCPTSGLLKIVPPTTRRTQPKKLTLSAGARHSICLWRNGVWYSVRLQRLPEDGTPRWDVWLNRMISRQDKRPWEQAYQLPMFAVSVTSASPDDIRRLLRNDHQSDVRKSHRHVGPAVSCHS